MTIWLWCFNELHSHRIGICNMYVTYPYLQWYKSKTCTLLIVSGTETAADRAIVRPRAAAQRAAEEGSHRARALFRWLKVGCQKTLNFLMSLHLYPSALRSCVLCPIQIRLNWWSVSVTIVPLNNVAISVDNSIKAHIFRYLFIHQCIQIDIFVCEADLEIIMLFVS